MAAAPMSVPGASTLMTQPALANQVNTETEEERRKRLAKIQQSRQLPAGVSSLAPGYGSALSTS